MEPPPGCKASYVFLVRECVALGALQQCCAISRCALWCYWVAYAQGGPDKKNPLVSLQHQLCHLLWKERGALQLRIAELAAIGKEATP